MTNEQAPSKERSIGCYVMEGVTYTSHEDGSETSRKATNEEVVLADALQRVTDELRSALKPTRASRKKLAEAKDLLDAIMNFAYLHGFHECGYNPAKVLTDEIERLNTPPAEEQDSQSLAWALQAHEDLAKMLADGGGNMLHVRANRALGILFAEVERLEKILYPIGTAHEPCALPTYTCPNCETKDEFSIRHDTVEDRGHGAGYPVVPVVKCNACGQEVRAELRGDESRIDLPPDDDRPSQPPRAGYQCMVEGCPANHASKLGVCGSDANVPANVALLQIRAAFTEAIALLRRWRKRESDCIPAGTTGDFRLFSETGLKASDWERTFSIGDHANDAPTPPPPAAGKPNKFDLAFEIMRQLEAEDMETMQSCQFGYVMRVTREGAAQTKPSAPDWRNQLGQYEASPTGDDDK